MANIKHVRSRTGRSLTQEGPSRKLSRVGPDLNDAPSNTNSTMFMSKSKKRSKNRKVPLLPAGRHAAFPSLEPGPNTLQLPPGRHDILRLVEEGGEAEHCDIKPHRDTRTREKIDQHSDDERISFRDLYPSIRQTIIDEICQDAAGIYRSDYTFALLALRIDENTLSAILKENHQVWTQDQPIDPHLIKLKLACPDLVIDPDTPPASEILKAMKFLEQIDLPHTLLGEWKCLLPILEEFITPPPQDNPVATSPDIVDAGARAQQAKDLAQETEKGLSFPELLSQPTRPNVSPITPVRKLLVTSKESKKNSGIGQEMHQHIKDQSPPPGRLLRAKDDEETRTFVRQITQTQKSDMVATSTLLPSPTCYQRKKDEYSKRRSVTSPAQKGESDGHRSNGQRQPSSSMCCPPLGRFPPPVIQNNEVLNTKKTKVDLTETPELFLSGQKPPLPPMSHAMKKQYQCLSPSRMSTSERQQSSGHGTSPSAQSSAAPVHTQKFQQVSPERLISLDMLETSRSRAPFATPLQSHGPLSRLPHMMPVLRQDINMSAPNCPRSLYSHHIRNSPNHQSRSPWQRTHGQTLPDSTAQRASVLQMGLQKKTLSPTRRVSPQYRYQHYLQPPQAVSSHPAWPEPYHQLYQGQQPEIISPPVDQMEQSPQFDKNGGQRLLQKSPTFATPGHMLHQGYHSAPGMQHLSDIYVSPPNMNLVHSNLNLSDHPTAQSEFGSWLPPHSHAPLATATPSPQSSQSPPIDPFFHSQGYNSSSFGETRGSTYNICNPKKYQPDSPLQAQSRYGDPLATSVVSQPNFVKPGVQNSASPLSPPSSSIYLSSSRGLLGSQPARKQHLRAPQPESDRMAGLIDPRLLPGSPENKSRSERSFESSGKDMDSNAVQGLVEVNSIQEINALIKPKKRKRHINLVFVESKIKEGEDDI